MTFLHRKEKLNKSAVIYTELGKRLISNYLARNVYKLDLKHNLVLDIDSGLITKTAPCSECDEPCACPEITYTVPVRAERNGICASECASGYKANER